MLTTHQFAPRTTIGMPSALSLVSPVIAGMPLICYASSANAQGTGVHNRHRAAAIATFEWFERAAFRRSKLSTARKPLDQLEDVGFRTALISALKQTTIGDPETVATHAFETDTAIDLSSGRVLEVPRILVSLDGVSGDSQHLPFTDSSGSACHQSWKACLRSAVSEFAERQCLCANWLTKKSNAVCDLVHNDRGSLPSCRTIIDFLLRSGVVRIFDISFDLKSYVYLTVFSSHRGDAKVKYACAAACKQSSTEALEKAFIELYQAYYYMSCLLDEDFAAHSGLDEDYRAANSRDTIELFGAGSNKATLRQLVAQPSFDADDLISSVTKVSDKIAYFSRVASLRGKNMYFGRLVSPDFFLHMSLGKRCNIDNRFARNCGVDPHAPISPLPFG